MKLLATSTIIYISTMLLGELLLRGVQGIDCITMRFSALRCLVYTVLCEQ